MTSYGKSWQCIHCTSCSYVESSIVCRFSISNCYERRVWDFSVTCSIRESEMLGYSIVSRFSISDFNVRSVRDVLVRFSNREHEMLGSFFLASAKNIGSLWYIYSNCMLIWIHSPKSRIGRRDLEGTEKRTRRGRREGTERKEQIYHYLKTWERREKREIVAKLFGTGI